MGGPAGAVEVQDSHSWAYERTLLSEGQEMIPKNYLSSHRLGRQTNLLRILGQSRLNLGNPSKR